jgi:hypothetical protein
MTELALDTPLEVPKEMARARELLDLTFTRGEVFGRATTREPARV